MSDFYKKMIKVQATLNAPKGQFNSFGKYHYRSCEDIMGALKPLLAAEGLFQSVSDEIVMIGDRHYVNGTYDRAQDLHRCSSTHCPFVTVLQELAIQRHCESGRIGDSTTSFKNVAFNQHTCAVIKRARITSYRSSIKVCAVVTLTGNYA